MSKPKNNTQRVANLAAQQFAYAKSQGAEAGRAYLDSKAESEDPDTKAAAEAASQQFAKEVEGQGGRQNKKGRIAGRK